MSQNNVVLPEECIQFDHKHKKIVINLAKLKQHAESIGYEIEIKEVK
jgi:hypothetical protein